MKFVVLTIIWMRMVANVLIIAWNKKWAMMDDCAQSNVRASVVKMKYAVLDGETQQDV
jgi:hypothetical protein